jgi:dipeptidase E
MKLLLTSGGISNRAISSALLAMVGKPASEVRVGFIPTAANVELYNKDWVIGQFLSLWRNGFSQIDIVDFSADGVDWKARLEAVDMLWLSGGNTFHLLDQARKTGFDTWLKKALKTKIYVGGSASSILMTPSIAVAGLEPGDENLPGLTDLTGLGIVPFEIEPHCDAARLEAMKEYAATSANPLYAIDDETAIQVIDGEVTVLSGGSWRYYE